MRYGTLGILIVGLALCFSSTSLASSSTKKPAKSMSASSMSSSSSSNASAARQTDTTVKGLIEKGVAAYMASDYDNAVEYFQQAIKADPSRPYSYYMLGQAFRASKNLDDALNIWQRGLQRATKDPNTRIKLMFVIADILEQQQRWDDAIAAWKQYADFLEAAPKLKGYPDTAAERIRVIERRKAMDAENAKVKERIQQRERETEVK